MKRQIIIASVVMACAIMLTACGDKNDDVKVIESSGSDSSTGKADGQETGYVLTVSGVDIPVDADASGIIEALGEPNSYFEAPSCAAQGIGKHYTYNDFEIETYPDGETDRILYVMLKSDAVSTAEGINLSSSRDDVKNTYGEPLEDTEKSLTYQKGDMKLKFIFDGEKIISIEYDSPLA